MKIFVNLWHLGLGEAFRFPRALPHLDASQVFSAIAAGVCRCNQVLGAEKKVAGELTDCYDVTKYNLRTPDAGGYNETPFRIREFISDRP